ncbi:MAG: PD40 domain-containing protein [Planctomycetes bacterium]|nr:PD40 domain-containing protein [Planctomycetota bacterium]MCW8136583.1 PD40 domain-containing protein [Planctomycetota bacterium]
MRLICLLMLASALAAQDAPKPTLFDPAKGEPGARHPAISDDGATVFFSLWGDIWRRDADGRCTQLTLHEAYDSYPALSPDGRHIAFSSDRAGNYDVYVIPSDGGPARRLTWHSSGDYVAGYSPDGEWIYFSSTRTERHALWRIRVSGGTEELVSDDDFIPGDVHVSADGIVYAWGSVRRYRRGYTGSSNEDLHLLRGGDNVPARLTEFEGNDRNGKLLAGGNVLFTREIRRSFQFMAMHADTQQPARQLTQFNDVGAEEVGVSANGQWIVYQRMHYLYRVRAEELLAAAGPGELIRLDPRQDTRGPQVEDRTFTEGMANPHLAGGVLAFELRGAIWVSSPEGGDARRLTEPGKGDTHPRVSPDGRLIAFASTRAGNSDIWLIEVKGGEPRQLTTSPANDFFHNWSPDGRKLVFCSERSGNRDIWLKAIDGSPAVQLTTDAAADDDPSFSPDGRLIAFDSARRGNADIWIMNADGSNQRFVLGTPDTEQCPVFSTDGSMLYFERWPSGEPAASLHVTTLSGAEEMPLARLANSVSETPDGRFVVFGQAGKVRMLPAPRSILAARDVPVIAIDRVDLAAERLALFNEAWQAINTRFYDDKFHGADWPAVRDKYLPLVARTRTIEECYYYIWMMIGELSASHLGVYGRTSGKGQVATADLGASFTPVTVDGRPGLRVDEIESGGPLDQAWVRKGDTIIGVAGRLFPREGNLWAHFDVWQAGYDLRLYVSEDGTLNKAREVAVRAQTWAQARDRRYNQKVGESRKRVTHATQGKVLYIHLSAMNPANLNNFRNLLASPQADAAQGLIIDARGNSGGLSYMEIMELLMAKPYLHIRPRTRQRWKQPRLFWDKPVTVLCDERSNSGGECFPWAIKTTGRGKVVGERTPGNVIGTFWDKLSDGTTFGVPTEGYFSMDDKRNLENDGVMPDVRVPMTARDRLLRLDPQLEEAIRVIQAELPKADAK